MATPPTTALQPGATGTAVKQLQDWLVSQGYLTQAQVNTGYGTYGPQTTAAVLAYQKANGVDYSSGPGYWGPRTMATVSGGSSSPQQQAVAGVDSAFKPTNQAQADALAAVNKAFASTPGSSSSDSSSAPKTNSLGETLVGTINGNEIYQRSDGAYHVGSYYGSDLQSIANYVYGSGAQFVPLGSSGTKTDTTPSNTPTGTGIAYDPSWSKYGIDQATWSSLNPTQQGVVAASLGAANTLYSSTGNKVDLASALARAATDPTIVNKYADALRLDTQQFSESLNQVKSAAALNMQQLQTQFENERLDLANKYASAGEAYSGYRGRAQEQLGQSEAGIVTSSLSQMQKQLDDATASFTSKYGSIAGMANPATVSLVDPSAASTISISGLDISGDASTHSYSGVVPAGVSGSTDVNKQQDINALAGQYVSLGQVPNVVQP